MTYILTNEQMRKADEYTISEQGVPEQTLMERAGVALAKRAAETSKGRMLVVCGGGNNGGDGFVCARFLRAAGYTVDAVRVTDKLSDACKRAMDAFLAQGGKALEEFPAEKYALVIDCLLGTGFCGELRAPYAQAIERINEYKAQGAKVLSADIPSGVNGDNGRVETVAVRADGTVCFGEYKAGVFLNEGIDYAGEVSRADIGIVLPQGAYAQRIEKTDAQALLPTRKRYSHKGSYGAAAIVAGSAQYTGAAYLALQACLRSGVGYAVLFTPQELLSRFMLKAPEALLKPLCAGSKTVFHKGVFTHLLSYQAIAYGMGLGASEEVAKGAQFLLKNYTGKLILDASALDSLAAHTKVEKLFQNKKCDVVITPHVKEFSRLSKDLVTEILEKGLTAPVAFAKSIGANVYLKNAVSLLTDGKETFVQTRGNDGLAKAGSGDVLSGVLAGLCAQGLSTLDSARLGGFLVGRAAEIAAETQSTRSALASDIIECLGKAFLEIEG